MSISLHARKKTFLAVHAALAALALSAPLAAATTELVITNSTSYSVTSTAFAISANGSACATFGDDCIDPLTNNSSGAAFIPGGGASAVASGGRVIVNGTTTSVGQYSVVGGGVISGNAAVIDNSVTLNSGATISGLVAGGFNGVSGGAGVVSGNTVTLNSGTIAKGNSGGGDVLGGGGLGKGDISGNQVIVNGGSVSGNVAGGWASVQGDTISEAAVKNNSVHVSSGTVAGNVTGGIAQKGEATGNKVYVSGGTISGGIVGGYAQHSASNKGASGNEVWITQGDAATITLGGKRIQGGLADGTGRADGNAVHISNAKDSALTVSAQIRGGDARIGGAASNVVEISGKVELKESVQGGYVINSSGSALYNQVEIGSGVAQSGGSLYIAGGFVQSGGAANYNTVTLAGFAKSGGGGAVYGGYVQSGNGSAIGNTVNLQGATTINGEVYGGRTSAGSVTSNTINIKAGATTAISGSVHGGLTSTGHATNNAIDIKGATTSIGGRVYGGVTTSGNATSNTINLQGETTVSGSVYGGFASAGSATGNTINLQGVAIINGGVHGGSGTGDIFTDNTLNLLNGGSATIDTVANFERIVFGNGGHLTSGTVTLGNSTKAKATTITVSSGDATVGAKLTGGNLLVTGGGKLILTDETSDYQNTTVSSGTLSIAKDENLGSGANTLSDGTLELTGASYAKGWTLANDTENTIDAAYSEEAIVFSGSLSGSGGLTIIGDGTLKLVGDNSDYAGEIAFGDGGSTIYISGDESLGKGEKILKGTTLVLENVTSGVLKSDWTLLGNEAVLTANDAPVKNLIKSTENVKLSGGYVLKKDSGEAELTFDSAKAGGSAVLIEIAGSLRNHDGLHVVVDTPVYLSTARDVKLVSTTDEEIVCLAGKGDICRYSYDHTTVKKTGTVTKEAATATTFEGLTLGANVTLTNRELTLEDGSKITGFAGAEYLVKETVNLKGQATFIGPESGDAFKFTAGSATEHATLNVFINQLDDGSYAMDAKDDTAVVVDVTGVKIVVGSRDKPVEDPVSVLENLFDPEDIAAGRIVGYSANNLIAPVGTLTGYGADGTLKADPQYKAVSEGIMGVAALVNQGGDVAAEKGVASAVAVAQSGAAGQGFGAIGGGQVKHKTGSHVDISGISLIAGVAAGVGNGSTVGGFVEYGDGNYDSYNKADSFRSGSVRVKGSGDSEYLGLGLLGRLDLPRSATGQPYLETTVRFGRAKSDFRTSDFRDINGIRISGKYDTRSNYHGLSLGGGHVWNIGKDGAFDLYGRYLWTHQAGDSVTVRFSNGDTDRVKFSAVDSHRIRAGVRYSRSVGNANRFHVGVAWEHEFDGEANAKVITREGPAKVEAPEMKGSTGIAEVGFVFTPFGNKNLSIDFGLQTYGGKRQGVTGSAQFRYLF